jgi:GTPase involved in cell partitioning and DNA repair
VKEQKERERALRGLLDKEKKEREKERECKEINAEMNKIKESRKNKMKMVLMEQLDEIEAKELKTNLKMMRQCFNVWRDHIERENATAIKRGKAIEKWRLTSRCWKAWKGVVNESHAHRLAEKDLERLRSERKYVTNHRILM